MLRFLHYIELFEAKVDKLVDQYPELEKEIRQYNDADPTSTKKFLQWLVKQHVAGNVTPDDARLTTTLTNFDKYTHKLDSKDHSTYDYNDLADQISKHVQDKIEQEGKNKAVRQVYNDSENGISAHHIASREASQKLYGGGKARKGEVGGVCGTSWCVAARGENNMYGNYGPEMHTIHVKGDDNAPYAVHAMNQAMSHPTITSRHNDGDLAPEVAFKKFPHIKKAYDAIIKDSATRLDKYASSNDSDQQAAALAHPDIDTKHLEKAIHSNEDKVKINAILHPKASKQILDIAQDDPSANVRATAASSLNLNSDQLMKAVQDKESRVVNYAASNPNLQDIHLDHLINTQKDDEMILSKILRHPNLSPELKKKAMSDPTNIMVRRQKASDSDASSSDLYKSLEDPDHEVRVRAAANPNLRPEHINKILNLKDDDRSFELKKTAISHQNASEANIDKALSMSNSSRSIGNLGSYALSNPNATAAHIDKAMKLNDGSAISAAFYYNPNVTRDHVAKGVKHSDWLIRNAAAKHPHATVEDHKHLLKNDDSDIVKTTSYEHLMKNDKANAAEHVQTALKDKGIAHLAASHPSVSGDQLKDIITKSDYNVAESALKNKNIEPEHLHAALDRPDVRLTAAAEMAAKHKKATSDVIHKALTHQSPYVRSAAMKNKNATPDHIAKALKDSDKKVRTNAIKHPNASHENIMNAVKDKLPSVAAQALKHPSATEQHAKEALNHPNKGVRDTANTMILK